MYNYVTYYNLNLHIIIILFRNICIFSNNPITPPYLFILSLDLVFDTNDDMQTTKVHDYHPSGPEEECLGPPPLPPPAVRQWFGARNSDN